MRPIRIFVDSTADLSPELIAKYDLTVIPLYVTIGGKAYKDMYEIKAQDIFDNYNKNKELPKTAAVSVADYFEAFRPVVEAGYDIIHFNISSDFSACYKNACIVAGELGHVYPVDSRNLSTGIAQLALLAAEEAAKAAAAELAAENAANASGAAAAETAAAPVSAAPAAAVATAVSVAETASAPKKD